MNSRSSESILRDLVNILYLLHHPGPTERINVFEQRKRRYFSLQEEWNQKTGIEKEISGPFTMKEGDFEKIEPLYLLNDELCRDDKTGIPRYDMLSGNASFNLPQRQRKDRIIRFALASVGVDYEKLYPSKPRDILRFISNKLKR
ncbi:MAG: hypothetical protein JWM20_697 [Patescibacteria group bacterium]|nr:hypothetical protein [Patescibacteria group bacterium]